MIRADLHCHSIYSAKASDVLRQRTGLEELYATPLEVYECARKQGMTAVTITDNDCMDGVLGLMTQYPDTVFTGVETSSVFPEDYCKIHFLIWGLSVSQWEEIRYHKRDIYNLRDYLKREGLAHAVAHLMLPVNRRLTTRHIEKLLLLFDSFEVLNGRRSRTENGGVANLMRRLTPAVMEKLYDKYRIEPFSDTPWHKASVGGSNDKGSLFVGGSYTYSAADSINSFLQDIRNKQSKVEGASYSYDSIGLHLYKIAFDMRRKPGSTTPKLFGDVAGLAMGEHALPFGTWWVLSTLRNVYKLGKNPIYHAVSEGLGIILKQNKQPDNEPGESFYQRTSDMIDAHVAKVGNLINPEEGELDDSERLERLKEAVPPLFLLFPFIRSAFYLPLNRALLLSIRRENGIRTPPLKRRTLWFSDTITELNGITVILKSMIQTAIRQERMLHLVACMDADKVPPEYDNHFINLPQVCSFKLPYYAQYDIPIPSFMQSLRTIYEYAPDQIVISTPGTMGLLGLLAGKIMQVRTICIYHTDLLYEAEHIVQDESAIESLAFFEKWFHNQMDELLIPTQVYYPILRERGIRIPEFKPLKRAIETDFFRPVEHSRQVVEEKYGLKEGPTLVYVGRIAPDKSLDLLADIYIALLKDYPTLNLLVVGEGVYRPVLQETLRGYERVIFTGKVERDELCTYYNAAELFVFPSLTDTFGLVVLEAQACGLPVVVSSEGGPKEVIIPGETGWVVAHQSLQSWLEVVKPVLDMAIHQPEQYKLIREKCRQNAVNAGGWDAVMTDMLGDVYL